MQGVVPGGGARPTVRSPQEAEELVVSTIQEHADALLKLARRHSLCADDAHDAYQRALEIFLRHASTLEADRCHSWLFTAVKHEAWAVREQRRRLVSPEPIDLDLIEARHMASPEDRMMAYEEIERSAEALQRMKPAEVRALWMRASGLTYDEIGLRNAWSRSKVKRCMVEGRASFLERCASIESGEECDRYADVLAAMLDGEADADELARARPHLRNCAACKARVRELHRSSQSLALLFPVALAVPPGAPDPDPAGMLSRVYEAFAGHLHERMVTSTLKLQAALDAASAGKVAAVAASAAAIAGGGIAAVDHTVAPPRARAAASHPEHDKAAAHTAAPPAKAVPPVTPTLRTIKLPNTSSTTAAQSHSRPRRKHRSATEFSRRTTRPSTREFTAELGRTTTTQAVARNATSTTTPTATPPPASKSFESSVPRRGTPGEASQEFNP